MTFFCTTGSIVLSSRIDSPKQQVNQKQPYGDVTLLSQMGKEAVTEAIALLQCG